MLNVKERALTVVPGDGLVHRDDGVVLLVTELADEHLPVVRMLLALCAQPTDPTGRRTVRGIAGMLANAEPSTVPSFALALDTDRGLVLLVHAEAEAVAEGPVSAHISGADSLAWVERRITGQVDVLRMYASAADARRADTLAAKAPFDLERGTVPGCAVMLHPHENPDVTPSDAWSEPAAMPQPVPAPVAGPMPDSAKTAAPSAAPLTQRSAVLPVPVISDPAPDKAGGPKFESVLLVDTTPDALADRTPLPVEETDHATARAEPEAGGHAVEGTLCSRGHFNDPESAYCSVCGISMQQRSRETVVRPRPSLGVVLLDDGSAFSLDSDYVLGRTPGLDEGVIAGTARPLVLDDDVSGVSRVHARLTLRGWQVRVTDEDAANGTYLESPAGASVALKPHEPTLLTNGTTIRIGRRKLVFHSYHSGGE